MRNKNLLVLYIVLLTFFLTPFLHAGGGSSYDSNQLMKDMKEYSKVSSKNKNSGSMRSEHFIGYVSGIYDATSNLYNFNQVPNTEQLCNMVVKYLKANPDTYYATASDLVIAALKGTSTDGQVTNIKPKKIVEKYQKKENWRSIYKRMSKRDIKEVLGEPLNITTSGNLEFWSYGTYLGRVTFDEDGVWGWDEPSSFESEGK
ncbi:MAG: Rap1a/Tai family immunity protein [Ignavibacteriaceae bacterium]|nr:Rap1a/Tai family immunity protein [Ignavibacteriaceae bacterium]